MSQIHIAFKKKKNPIACASIIYWLNEEIIPPLVKHFKWLHFLSKGYSRRCIFNGNCSNRNGRFRLLLDIVLKKKFANCTPLNFKIYFYCFHVRFVQHMLSMVSLNCLINFCPFFGSTTYMTTKTHVRDQKQKLLWISHL